MLRRLRVKNFKLLRDVEIEFEAGAPTVLIGPNASGKSTVIEVLDFLGRCAQDGLQEAVVAHGGISTMSTAGAGTVEIDTEWNFAGDLDFPWDQREDLELHWKFKLSGLSGSAGVFNESLRDGERVLVGATAQNRHVAFDESKPDHGRAITPGTLAFEGVNDSFSFPRLARLRERVGAIRVLGALATTPSWARSSVERASARDSVVLSTQEFVGREGLGLAAALYNLHTDHGDAWGRLERAFKGEFPFVRRIVFPADPGGSRISFAIEDQRFSGRKIYASEMSDGMIVYLCLLSLILHPQQKGVLALDEPDAHLHPSALRRLMALAHEQHGTRALVIATHSNVLLDELRDPAASVRIVEPSPEGARIRRLDPDALTAWRTDYSLSDLRRTGLLDSSNTAYPASAASDE